MVGANIGPLGYSKFFQKPCFFPKLHISPDIISLVNYFITNLLTIQTNFLMKFFTELDNGLCVAGLIPVVLNICILSFDLDIKKVGGICFCVFSAIIVIGAICYTKMVKDPLFQYYTNLPQNITMISTVALTPLGVENINRQPQVTTKY